MSDVSDAESMDNTMVKRKKGHLPEGHSLDSKLPAIMEATESNGMLCHNYVYTPGTILLKHTSPLLFSLFIVFSPVFNSAVHNELVTAQPPDICKPIA